MKIETVTLPAYWASALINGDYSGLEDSEAAELTAWIKDNPFYGDCLSCSDYPELAFYGATFLQGVLAECLEYTFPVQYYKTIPYEFFDGRGVRQFGETYSLIYPVSVKTELLWHQKQGLSYTATGYGKKIPTSKMILLEGKWRRVYCTIYSNIGSCWIIFHGKKINVESAL